MTTEIIEPERARALLTSDEFISGWSKLWEDSASATQYQSPQFAVTWYKGYAERFEPLLVVARDASGRMIGLLPLAWSQKENVIGAAGLWQSEYQGWIATAAMKERFGASALSLVARRFPASTIRLRYCLSGSMIDRSTPPQVRDRCRITRRQRPILRLDAEAIARSFRKSGNKNRLRQLRKMGPIEFRQITDPAELERMFDEIVAQHDARRLACTGRRPFSLDPQKKSLYLSLMQIPNLLHVTILTVGGKLASAQLNMREADHVQLHLITHSAEFAKHSPGKLHLMFLSQMLVADGCRYIDLTPGDEIFKRRSADESTDVHELTIHPSRAARLAAAIRESAAAVVKRIVQRIGVRPPLARMAVRGLTNGGIIWQIKAMLNSIGRWFFTRDQIAVFSFAPQRIAPFADPTLIRRNSVHDLMAYQPQRGAPPAHIFVASALAQIEAGGHFYTHAEAGRLQAVARTSLLPLSCLPSGGCVLIEEQLPRDCADAPAMTRSFMHSIFEDLARRSTGGKEFIAVRATCLHVLQLASAMQFDPEYSICDRCFFGVRWRRVSRLVDRPALTTEPDRSIDEESFPTPEEIPL